jgi:dTDP-glucose pyrophosphorylase
MKSWERALVSPDHSIKETISAIDAHSLQIALVVDDDRRLLGTVTDGDVRRGLLRGVALSERTQTIMNPKPTVARQGQSRQSIVSLLQKSMLHHLPVVDDQGCIVGLEVVDDLLQPAGRDNWVVLMAGGLGTRLQPLTNSCPKPMLKVGNTPILEIILKSFAEQGFTRFFISVNFKAQMFEEYFGDGSRWNVEIQYLREQEKMGTAGSLSLLPQLPERPLIVMNADLITKINFGQFIDFHTQSGSKATMAVREYDFQIPYGVVRLENERIVNIDEKPVQRFFVNAGIYVLSPEVVGIVPSEGVFNMTTLFEDLMKKNVNTNVFPIREYWLDIGQMSDFEKANGDFDTGPQ